eukprot:TRINITY_DN863_c0_g1_i9.p2 TRINITY_DN863_c0_g1~~TRINITY_DN863_c0_g1_i9.p2  ORF type:complete len:142 (-),score=39.87 TRINITY_DN863_c0_g1_i9:305-670(-)
MCIRDRLREIGSYISSLGVEIVRDEIDEMIESVGEGGKKRGTTKSPGRSKSKEPKEGTKSAAGLPPPTSKSQVISPADNKMTASNTASSNPNPNATPSGSTNQTSKGSDVKTTPADGGKKK